MPSQSDGLAAATAASVSALAAQAECVQNLTCPFPSEGRAMTMTPIVTWRAVVARRTLCVAAKSNFRLKRIQKIDYLGFLEVTQGVERVPRGRALHIMPLNGVVCRR